MSVYFLPPAVLVYLFEQIWLNLMVGEGLISFKYNSRCHATFWAILCMSDPQITDIKILHFCCLDGTGWAMIHIHVEGWFKLFFFFKYEMDTNSWCRLYLIFTFICAEKLFSQCNYYFIILMMNYINLLRYISDIRNCETDQNFPHILIRI